jgi:subtilase family serine protease
MVIDSSVEQTAFHDVHNAYDPVNPGKSRSMVGTSYIFPSGGRYTCRAVIDSTNTIAESNEGNNTFTRVEVIPDY